MRISGIVTLLASVLALVSAQAHADCFQTAAREYKVSPTVLRAIAAQESSNNPRAVRRNRNGSVDYGLMQVNSIHLPELNKRGIHRRDLMNACKNINVAAGILASKVKKYGRNYRAVGAYHSETPALRKQYAALIREQVAKLQEKSSMQLASLP